MLSELFQRWTRQDSALHVTLTKVPLFEGLNRRALREIEQIFEARSYEPGGTIFGQGDVGVGMFVVISGEVEIAQKEDGEPLVLAQIGEAGFFGETALLDDSPRTANAVATQKTEVAFFPRSGLLSLAEHRPHLGVKMVMQLSQTIAERLRRTNRGLRAAREKVEAIKKADEGSE